MKAGCTCVCGCSRDAAYGDLCVKCSIGRCSASGKVETVSVEGERGRESDRQEAGIERVAAAARNFLRSYDEFHPEYPYALAEPLRFLEEALEGLAE